MSFIGIIPARYASRRFPGKPLVLIGKKTMIQRVYEQASKVLDSVIVATDDVRIQKAVEEFGGIAVMTSTKHKSGTDRCSEAIENYYKPSLSPEFLSREQRNKERSIIVNIQGDEPFIQPQQLEKVMSCFEESDTQIATLMKPIELAEDIFDPNTPKVITNLLGDAMYFSRSPIPYLQSIRKENWLESYQFFKHVGIYGYRYDILKEITKLEQTPLETSESLEQNRWLQHGYKIKVKTTELESIAVDTEDDLRKIKEMELV